MIQRTSVPVAERSQNHAIVYENPCNHGKILPQKSQKIFMLGIVKLGYMQSISIKIKNCNVFNLNFVKVLNFDKVFQNLFKINNTLCCIKKSNSLC